MKLAFDTNILIEIDLVNTGVIEKLKEITENVSDEPSIPSPVVSEYYYGFLGTRKKEAALKILENYNILNTSRNSAIIFAEIKDELKKSGQIISDMDLLIASICIDNNATLITADKQFEKIKELKKIIL